MKKKTVAGIVIAILIFLVFKVFQLVPTTEMLTESARDMLCVVLMIIVLLITEAFPFGITCLVGLAFMYFMGCVGSMADAFSGYTNKTLFFVLASFGISKALVVVPVSKRLLIWLMQKCGKNIKLLMFGVMCCVALLSSVISNVATCAVFVPIIGQFLQAYDNEADRKRSGRAFMIAVPVASMIGGMMTPAGSSLNVLVMNMLEQNTGLSVSFVQWMALGIPLTLVVLPFAWFVFCLVYKPASLSQERIQTYVGELRKEIPEKLEFKEIYVVGVLILMFVLWVSSSWIKIFDITAVAFIGLFLYFLPGKLRVMTWKDYTDSISLEAYFVFGSMICIGNAVAQTGLSSWIASVAFPSSFPASLPMVIAFVAVLTFLLLIPIPVAPAVITMLAGSLCAWGTSLGIAVAPVMVAFGMVCNNCYLLPLDTVPLISYATGYYDIFDMPKGTVWVQLAMVVLSALWLTVGSGFIL